MDTGMTTAAQKVAYAQACAETLPAGQLRATALAAAALARIRLELGATGAVAPAAAIACALAGDAAFAHESHYHYRSDPPDFVTIAAEIAWAACERAKATVRELAALRGEHPGQTLGC